MIPARGGQYIHGDPAVFSFFVVFLDHSDVPGPPKVYGGANGKVVIYDSNSEAEAAAAEFTAANRNPNISFTVTEFQPRD